MLPCRSAAIPSGCGAPAGNVAKRSTWPRSQAAASSGQSERQASTPTTARRKAAIRTSSSKGVDRIVLRVAYSQPKRKGGPQAAFPVRQRTVSYFTSTGISCASSRPLLLSSVTTISPRGGVTANSAEFTEITTLVLSVAPGATAAANPPSLIALDHGAYFARPATALLPPLIRSKLVA